MRNVREHIAQAGFDPVPDRRGRTAAERHFRKHVEQLKEWPEGTTLRGYLDSARRVILDTQSNLLVSRYQGFWQIAAVRSSGDLRGPHGSDWVVVEYRLGLGQWVTAYQPDDLEQDFLKASPRQEIRWLKQQS